MTIAASRADAPVRILYALASFPVTSETFVSNEIRAMRRFGHHVVPLALAPHGGTCQPEDEVFHAETIPLASIPSLRAAAVAAFNPAGLAAAAAFARRQHGLPARWLLRAASRVALAARQNECTHIHAHFAHVSAAIAITAGRMAGVTTSFMGHGYEIYGTPSDLPVKLAAVDLAVATCEDMRQHFLHLCPTTNVRVVGCGVDPDRFRPHPGPSNGRLLAIGRLVEQKGYPLLFEALAMIPHERRPAVDIIGAGPLEAELIALADHQGLGDKVRFMGRQPSTMIAAEGPRYQGFVAPYVVCNDGDRDTSPVALKEALAMGLPSVASRLMGMKETLNASCGRHVTPGDAAELSAAIEWLTGLDPDQRRVLGEAGRAHALASFTLDANARQLTAAIRALQDQRALPCAA